MKEYHLWSYLPLSLEMRVLWLEAKKRESSPTPILLREEDAKAKEKLRIAPPRHREEDDESGMATK
jgi:hypothetical protein